MMKKKLLFILSLTFIGISCFACLDDETKYVTQKKTNYPLTAFAVAVNNVQTGTTSYYHGKIDQTTHKIEIGTIENANVITGVDYTLMDGASISPDPATFIQNWQKEQKVTVTTANNQSITYTIVLPKYDETLKDIIFIDDFNVNGIPNPNSWVLCQKSTSDWCDEMSESYDQAYVEDGKLILKAEKIGNEYRAGGIESIGKVDFTFGRVEVRARIPRHPDGAFPAIWLMPQKSAPLYSSWPNGGEIDIMEHIRQEDVIYQTVHTHYTYDLNIKDPINSTSVTCSYEDWNIYAVEWTEDKITFFVNDQKTFSYENLDLSKLMGDIFHTHQLMMPEGVELKIRVPHEPLIIRSDHFRLTQVCTNFINNAVKFTAKGYIEIGYELSADGKSILISVKDTGKGIPDDKKEKVFERFQKLDEFAQGTGLGLAICQSIVHTFHGSISLESEVDVGSKFTISLPYTPGLELEERT